MTNEQKADLIGLIRCYFMIPVWWAIYLGRGYM